MTGPLNFVVTGPPRSGLRLLQTAIDTHPDATCHGDLLAENRHDWASSHIAYFGSNVGMTAELGPELYLDNVFKANRCSERALGLRLSYDVIARYDLWEYLAGRANEGDFTLIMLHRSPISCYVSWRQARDNNRWTVDDDTASRIPQPVSIDAEEVTQFCRDYATAVRRLRRTCPDRVELKYRELSMRFGETLEALFEFLELSPHSQAEPVLRQLSNRPMRDRMADTAYVRSQLPGDVIEFFDDPNLF